MTVFPEKEMKQIFGETLAELGGEYPNMMVADADLHTTINTTPFRDRYYERFVECGIAEANMMGVSAGLAKLGFIVFPSTFAAFITRKALDPLFTNICCQKLNVKISGSYCGLTACECGQTHNVCDDIATVRSLPHIRIVDPGDNNELRSMLREIMKYNGPVYFRITNKTKLPDIFDESYQFEWGKAHVLKEGTDVTLCSTGLMTSICIKAAELLEREGIHAEVLHTASIRPLDEETIMASAKKTGCILTAENGRVFGGFGSAVAEAMARRYPVVMDMVGLEDEPAACANLGTLLEYHKLTPWDVAERAKALMKKKK